MITHTGGVQKGIAKDRPKIIRLGSSEEILTRRHKRRTAKDRLSSTKCPEMEIKRQEER